MAPATYRGMSKNDTATVTKTTTYTTNVDCARFNVQFEVEHEADGSTYWKVSAQYNSRGASKMRKLWKAVMALHDYEHGGCYKAKDHFWAQNPNWTEVHDELVDLAVALSQPTKKAS